ncbi:MAG: DUF1648 domain-containing protein [Thermomicrobiales bacterium]
MRRWRPAPSGGSLVGILALLLCASALAGLVFRAIPDARGNTPALVAFWVVAVLLVAAIGALGVLVWGYLTLGYLLEETGEGALVLRWAWRRVVIPLDEIEYLGGAKQLLAESEPPRLWPWPGYYLSTVRDEALGRIQLFATLPPRSQLLVCSARGSFGFSPDRPTDFLARFHEFYAARHSDAAEVIAAPLPSTRLSHTAPELEDEEDQPPPQVMAEQRAFREQTAAQPVALFADPSAVTLMLLGGALLTAMLWFILWRYDSVPEALPLHYNTLGQPDRIGSAREIFLLPLIAGVVAAANIALAWSVIRFDRFAARLLLSGTCLVQAVTWVALLKLI